MLMIGLAAGLVSGLAIASISSIRKTMLLDAIIVDLVKIYVNLERGIMLKYFLIID
jgi:hypothetical protein